MMIVTNSIRQFLLVVVISMIQSLAASDYLLDTIKLPPQTIVDFDEKDFPVGDPRTLFEYGKNYLPDPAVYTKFVEENIMAFYNEHSRKREPIDIAENEEWNNRTDRDFEAEFYDPRAREIIMSINKLIFSKFDEIGGEYGIDYVDFTENTVIYHYLNNGALFKIYQPQDIINDDARLWPIVKRQIETGRISLEPNTHLVYENHWYKEAVNRVIDCQDAVISLAYYRALQHNGGFVPFDSTKPLAKVFFNSFYELPCAKQYLLDPLTDHLKSFGINQPYYTSGKDVAVYNADWLTVDQAIIVAELFTGQSNTLEYKIKGYDTVYNFVEQGVKKFGDVVILENFISDGPLFIKAKKLILRGNIDVLGGMVAVAEQLDLSNARIWNFGHTHCLCVKNINLQDSPDISN